MKLLCAALVFLCGPISNVSGELDPRLRRELPADLATAMESDDPQDIIRLIEATFQRHLGEPFPDLELIGRNDASARVSDFHGTPLLVMYAGGPCPYTLAEIERLRKQGRTQDGRRLLIVIKNLRSREMRAPLAGMADVFEFAGWPPTGYLAYLRVYPVYFFINEEGRLTGFQIVMREKFTEETLAHKKGGKE